jgi:hypothetical protein
VRLAAQGIQDIRDIIIYKLDQKISRKSGFSTSKSEVEIQYPGKRALSDKSSFILLKIVVAISVRLKYPFGADVSLISRS